MENKLLRINRILSSAWSRIEGKLALKTGIAAAISLVVGLYMSHLADRPDWLISGLWCVMTAIVVLQAHIGGTYKAALERFLGVLIGSLIGALFSSVVERAIPLDLAMINLGLSVFSTVILCSLLNIKESLRIASMSTAAIVLVAGLHLDITPWMFTFFRFLDSCLGIIVALVVAHLFWPEKAIKNLKENVSKVTSLMSKYYRLAIHLEKESFAHQQSMQEISNEIQAVLIECRSYLEESKLEFRPSEFINGWSIALNLFETAFETITTLGSVHKETLVKIFDDSLADQVSDLVEKTDMVLSEIEKIFVSKNPLIHASQLQKSLEFLGKEMARFRNTRTTRKFNIEDVEAFFVFFFSLRLIGETILKLEKQTLGLRS